MEATALTTTASAAPAVTAADQARIAAALESEPSREHHPRLPIGLGSLVTLARRARPPDHASRAVVACLTQRAEQGAAADPCKHTGVVQVRCSRACRAPARAVAAGVAANGGRSLAGLRDAALIQVMSDALFRISEAAALNVADVQRQADGSGTVTVRSSKTDQEGRGHIRYLGAPTMQRLSAWLSAAGITTGGPLFR